MKKLLLIAALLCVLCSCGSEKSSHHECVDLGLSVKWATCNVGASSPGEYGDLFTFGEIAGGEAMANWGGDWRMPNESEIRELTDNCTWTWTTQDGHNGYKVTGPSGESIFLPAAGADRYDGYESEGRGQSGSYWSSTGKKYMSINVYTLDFSEGSSPSVRLGSNDSFSTGKDYRYSLRPVMDLFE